MHSSHCLLNLQKFKHSYMAVFYQKTVEVVMWMNWANISWAERLNTIQNTVYNYATIWISITSLIFGNYLRCCLLITVFIIHICKVKYIFLIKTISKHGGPQMASAQEISSGTFFMATYFKFLDEILHEKQRNRMQMWRCNHVFNDNIQKLWM